MNEQTSTPSKQEAMDQADRELRAKMNNAEALKRRANTEAFPGALRLAFVDEPPVFEGFTFRPIVAGDYIVLRKLDSPIYRDRLALAEYSQRVMGGETETPAPDTKITGGDIAELLFLLSNPIRVSLKDLREGRAFFQQRALDFVTKRNGLETLQAAVPVITAHFESAFGTFVEYRAPDKDGEVTYSNPLLSSAKDGLGWWLSLVARLAREFHWPLDYILYDLPLLQAFAFSSFTIVNNGVGPVDPVSLGYIGQEIERLRSQRSEVPK